MANRLLLLFFLVQSSCATTSQGSLREQFPKNDKIMKVSVGQTISQLKEILGSPSSTSTETFPSAKFEVWEYSFSNHKPSGFFTLDSTNKRVVGRSIEFYGSDAYDVDKLLNDHFKEKKFDQKYAPCHARGHEEVLVDALNGIFIATRDGKALMVSWADPQLTKLRIEDFYLKCPKLQPHRK
jgi:outer membrane protein assembly factor BamE (lipoprotein component of BamABCDE complex)